MFQIPVIGIRDVANAKQFLNLIPALIGDGNGFVFFVDSVVAGPDFLVDGFLNFRAALDIGNDAVDAVILVGGLLAGAGNNERGTRLGDEDGIDYVDDG